MRYNQATIKLPNGQEQVYWLRTEPEPTSGVRAELTALDTLLDPIEAAGCQHVTQVREYISRRLAVNNQVEEGKY